MSDGTDTSSLFGDMSGSDWLNLALKFYAANRSTQPGKFTQAPDTPEQAAMRQKLFGFIDNSPTRALLGGMLGKQLAGPASAPFQLPKGANGYEPYKSTAPDYSGLMDALKGSIGGGASTPVLHPPSAPGGAGTQLPPALSGGSSPFGGYQSMPSSPATGGSLSGVDSGAFTDFIRTYGKSAGEFVIALLTSNPIMGIKGAIDLYKSYSGNNNSGDGQHYNGNPNPTGAQWTTPNTPGSGVTDPNARTDWTPNQGPGYQDFWSQMDQNLRNPYGAGGGATGVPNYYSPTTQPRR